MRHEFTPAIADAYGEKKRAIAKYLSRGIFDHASWDKLHDEISLAYRKGFLSDNEYDHLLSEIHRTGR